VPDAPVVAIVDDDESFRQALERFLRIFAFRVHTFASGEDFLHSSELRSVACLLLDVAMPGMSGLEVMQQVRTRGLRIPTLLVTAQAADADFASCKGRSAREEPTHACSARPGALMEAPEAQSQRYGATGRPYRGRWLVQRGT